GRTAEAAATAERMLALDPTAEPRAATGVSRKSTAELVFLDLDEAPPPQPAAPAPEPARAARPSMPAAQPPRATPTVPPVATPAPPAPREAPVVSEPPDVAPSLEIEHTSLSADVSIPIEPTPLADLEPTSFALPDDVEAPAAEPLELTDREAPPSLDDTVGGLELLEPTAAAPIEPEDVIELEPIQTNALEPEPLAAESLEAATLEADVEPLLDEIDDGSTEGGDLVFILPEDDPPPAEPEVGRRSTMFAAQSVEILRAAVDGEPDDWSLRRELAEAMLEAGDRLGGIQHLEIAMAGADASGDLDLAASLATELARLEPETIQHHQKRVEFAFRANDRPRLIEAYLSLADALLRAELPEKATAAYQRVLEIAPDEARATAALDALAPAAIIPPSSSGSRVSQPAIPRVSQPVRRSGAFTQPVPPPASPAPPPPATSHGPARMPLSTPRENQTSIGGGRASAPTEQPRIPTRPTPRQGGQPFAAPAAPASPPPRAPSRPAAPPPPAATLPAAAPAAADDSFVNLGDWLRESEAPRDTRMVVEEKEPTGDEDADFADMLRKFKQGVAENVEADDYQSHYDLGIAHKEMGLVDEAIYEFQRALGGAQNRVATYEALGDCFLGKSQFT